MAISDKAWLAILAMPAVVGLIRCLLLREWALAGCSLLCFGLVPTMCGLVWLMQRTMIKLMNELFDLRRDPVIKQRILELEKKASSSSSAASIRPPSLFF